MGALVEETKRMLLQCPFSKVKKVSAEKVALCCRTAPQFLEVSAQTVGAPFILIKANYHVLE